MIVWFVYNNPVKYSIKPVINLKPCCKMCSMYTKLADIYFLSSNSPVLIIQAFYVWCSLLFQVYLYPILLVLCNKMKNVTKMKNVDQ